MKNQLEKWGIEEGTFWGALLVFGGLFFLLQVSGLFNSAFSLIWSSVVTAVFAIGSAAFLTVFLSSPRENWWAAIPGFTLFGLFVAAVADYFGPFVADLVGGFFLASIGIGFLAVYLFNREQWWAIIPFGILTTLGIVAASDELASRWEWTNFESGSIFFLGLGLTFLLVAILPAGKESKRWAFIPAAALLIVSLLIGVNLAALVAYVGPLALIGGGAYLLVRSRNEKSISSR